MNKSIISRGFTLIELLVVIAIIGILAAVVLASLNDARQGGSDASIKQSMTNMRSQAEIFYNARNFTYTAVCTDPNVLTLRRAAKANGPGAAPAVTLDQAVRCNTSARTWASAARLNTGSTASAWHWFCVDSSGKATTTSRTANPPIGTISTSCP